MANYIRVPIETDPDMLAQDAYDYIIARAPQWVPNDGNLDVWIIQAMAANAAESRDLASDVLDTIYRDFGSSLMGIPPIDAASASADTTWTMIDNLGHTIPAGTTVSIGSADEPTGFTTMFDVTILPGATTTATGEVQIIAVTPGAASSGLGAQGQSIQLVDILDFVQGVVLEGSTQGGVDAEADEDYLVRLVRRLRGLSQRPILPVDFSEMAKDADPAVYRATAIDGYDPVAHTYNNDRMIAVAAVDQNGNAANTTMKTNIDNLLEANREVNFIVNIMDPNFTIIDVTATVVAVPNFDKSVLHDSVVASIQKYLSPALWGRDPQYTDASADQTWVDQRTLYYNDILSDTDKVEGVARVTDIAISRQGSPLARTDVALTPPASLTQPGNILVTVT